MVPLDLAKDRRSSQKRVLDAIARHDTYIDEAMVPGESLVENSAPLVEGRSTVAMSALTAGDQIERLVTKEEVRPRQVGAWCEELIVVAQEHVRGLDMTHEVVAADCG